MKRVWDREGTHQQANAALPCCLEQSEGSAGWQGWHSIDNCWLSRGGRGSGRQQGRGGRGWV
jgi:hypothetical protein